MASKSPIELIREIQIETTALRGILAACDRRVLDLADFGGLISRLATAEEQLSELKKWRDESDRRRWQTQLLFFGSLLTLAIQLTVLFLKK